jgi:hypothetical protein
MKLFRNSGTRTARTTAAHAGRVRTPSAWDRAVDDLKALYGQLCTTVRPADRAALYEQIAAAEEACASAVDPDVMPPLKHGEGTSYAQVYADSARLWRILAGGERVFGQYKPLSVNLDGVAGRAARDLWGRYLASADRAERAELLIELSAVTERAIGYGAASVLDLACTSERELARAR